MNMLQAAIKKYNPAVPKRFLFAVSGVLWMAAGTILCVRAVAWLDVLSFPNEILLLAISLALGLAGYVFGFSRVVQKNVGRICLLPDRTCVFAFTAWKGYIMIAAMITLGMTLRSTTVPKHYLSFPYAVMGSVLLMGSVGFFRRFFGGMTQENQSNEEGGGTT
jgi:hypothetical protein